MPKRKIVHYQVFEDDNVELVAFYVAPNQSKMSFVALRPVDPASPHSLSMYRSNFVATAAEAISRYIATIDAQIAANRNAIKHNHELLRECAANRAAALELRKANL